MPKYNRQIDARFINDPHSAEVYGFNQPAGAKKVTNVGSVLLPIPTGSTFTCDATTAIALPAIGKNIAVYNNSGSVGSITLGKTSAVTSLAAGVTNSSGQAGIPCMPNSWTYIAMGLQQFVIASASTLLVYIIEDGTYLVPESN